MVFLLKLRKIVVFVSPGTLVLLGGLDRETRSTYLLHIEVSDGGVDGANVLTAEATVNVSVLDTNEFSPTFVGGPVYQVIVLEELNKFNLTVHIAKLHLF